MFYLRATWTGYVVMDDAGTVVKRLHASDRAWAETEAREAGFEVQ